MTGDGSSGIYVWGWQSEIASTASPYQRVTAQSSSDFISENTYEGWTLNGNTFIQNTGKDVVHTIGGVGLETTAGMTVTSPGTMAAVGRFDGAAATMYFTDSRSSPTDRWITGVQSASPDNFGMYQGTGFINQPYDTDPHVHTYQFNGDATSKITVSSVGSETGDVGSSNFDFGTVFANTSGGATLKGYIGQLVVFDREMTAAEVSAVEFYLRQHYGGL